MMDFLVGKADRIPFLQSVEKQMRSAREALDMSLCVDTTTDNIWHGMNETMHLAALEHLRPEAKMSALRPFSFARTQEIFAEW